MEMCSWQIVMWKSRFQNFHCCERKKYMHIYFLHKRGKCLNMHRKCLGRCRTNWVTVSGNWYWERRGLHKVSFLVYTFIHSFSKYWLNFYYVAAMGLQMRPLLCVEGEADDKKNYINEQHNFRHNFNTLRSMQKKMGWSDG